MPVNIKSYSIKSLIDPTTWTTGNGSATGFSVNGAADENHRFMDTDPFGIQAMVWEARPDATSGADGGWNGSTFSIDNTKLYRFSVWVNRTVQGNGSFYFGLRGYNSSNSNVGVYNRSNGSNNTNPYFWSTATPTTVGEWTLVVGHVWPVGSGTGANHPDSGRYRIDGGRIGGVSLDFVWRSDNTQSLLRTYLYYSTDTSARQRWVYPRVDLVDGTEPSIDELLLNPPGTAEISAADVREMNYDSVVQNGLVLHLDAGIFNTVTGTTWYDLSGNGNHGTNSNITYSSSNGGIFYFNDSNSVSIIPNSNSLNPTTGLTIESWVKFNQDSADFIFEKGNVNTQYSLFSHGNDITFRTYHAADNSYHSTSPSKSSLGISNNTWHHIVGSWDGSTKKIYVDGIFRSGVSKSGDLITRTTGAAVGRFGGTTTGYYFGGYIPIIRVYNKGLSAQEIEHNFNVQKGRFGFDYVAYEALTFTSDSNITVDQISTTTFDLHKTSGNNAAWDGQAYSNESFTAPCTIEFYKKAESSDNSLGYSMIGWTTDPTSNNNYNTIDIAAYPYQSSTFKKYANGSNLGDSVAWDPNKKIYVSYDTDGYVRFYNGSTLLYSYNYGTGNTVYVDSSFYRVNSEYGKFSSIRVARKSWNGTEYV